MEDFTLEGIIRDYGLDGDCSFVVGYISTLIEITKVNPDFLEFRLVSEPNNYFTIPRFMSRSLGGRCRVIPKRITKYRYAIDIKGRTLSVSANYFASDSEAVAYYKNQGYPLLRVERINMFSTVEESFPEKVRNKKKGDED